jgi:hypothetical protein
MGIAPPVILAVAVDAYRYGKAFALGKNPGHTIQKRVVAVSIAVDGRVGVGKVRKQAGFKAHNYLIGITL